MFQGPSDYFDNYAENTSAIMNHNYSKDISSDNLLTIGNTNNKSDESLINIQIKKKNNILWHEISTNS